MVVYLNIRKAHILKLLYYLTHKIVPSNVTKVTGSAYRSAVGGFVSVGDIGPAGVVVFMRTLWVSILDLFS